jgi:hypothetical protein
MLATNHKTFLRLGAAALSEWMQNACIGTDSYGKVQTKSDSMNSP